MNITEREYLTILRRKKKIRIKDIATVIGCSSSLISKYENGEMNMGQRNLENYIKYIKEYIHSNASN